ncbi:hypothetical protein [Pseudomonas mosselii]|uniref:hypothetical protein n=1 Tax=Pseudomonas mosselii TaxID=78327 RepID=UPI003F3F20B0
MSFEGTVIEASGQNFAVVIVPAQQLASGSAANAARHSFQPYFPGMPILLLSKNAAGAFHFDGRPELVKCLAGFDASEIAWMRYKL